MKNNKNILLVDADSLCFHGKNILDLQTAINMLDSKIESMMNATNIYEAKFFLTKGRNIRYEIYPEYKANRVGKDRPQFASQLKDYLIEKHNAVYDEKWEADDLVIDAYRENNNGIVCSMDKDVLKNIPGKHFNLYSNEFIEVTEEEAFNHFHKQIILGDSTDNILPIKKGLGPKTMEKLLQFTKLPIDKLAKYLCEIENVDYEIRNRLLFCGKEIPELIKESGVKDQKIINTINTLLSIGKSFQEKKEKQIKEKKEKTTITGKKTKSKYHDDFIWKKGMYKNDEYTLLDIYVMNPKYIDWLIENTMDNALKQYLTNLKIKT